MSFAAPRGGASLERLRAPSVRAAHGETLAGQRIGVAARWVGRRRATALTRRSGGYRCLVAAGSAVIVTVHLTAPRSPRA